MSPDKEIYFSKDLFDYCYFETDFCNFNKFIKLTSNELDCSLESKKTNLKSTGSNTNKIKKSNSNQPKRL
jgi:hypothetical protein